MSTTTSGPGLPDIAALQTDDSMLTRRFGKEVVNYYAGGRINRYSFLRADTGFLRQAYNSPTARYLALHDLNPLVVDKKTPAYLTFKDVEPLIGPDHFTLTEDEAIQSFNSIETRPLVVFIGMLEEGNEKDSISSSDHGDIQGHPYFAIDITPKGNHAEKATQFLEEQEKKGLSLDKNPRAMNQSPEAAALYAQARSIIDWNTRSPFCAGCGLPNLSVHAGYKRVCPPADKKGGASSEPRGDCPTRHGVSNICFPRTDPTMIAAVVSADGTKILLGRQKRWPPHWYSTLAGFLEPGESIEESVRREVWEESGVRVGRVVIHSSQPWPYPSSLMIGAIAQALPGDGEKISLNDKELEVAKWFSIDEARQALKNGTSSLGEPAPEGYKEGDLRLPPPQAIANRLITAVVEGYLTVAPKIVLALALTQQPTPSSSCIKTIENTKVVQATDYAIWESQEPIASALEEFYNTNRTTKSGNFYMLSPTTAVAIAAILNLKHVVINSNGNNKHVINAVSESAVWACLGLAIDVWPQTGESHFFVKKSDEDSKSPTVGKVARESLHQPWVKSALGAPCLKKGTVDAPQIIHRRQALSEGKEILEKLGNRKFKQNDPALIREDADTDLSVWKYMGKTGATLASLVFDEIDWIQLAQQVNDAESTAGVKKLVELSDKAREIQNSQQNYLQEAIPSLMELRTTLLEKPGCQSFQQVFGPAWNECLLSQEADGTKNIIVGALQRLFDTIAYAVSRTHPMYGAFLDMASKMDIAVMSSLDLDLVRAKDRHQKRLNINDDLSYRNEIMVNVAEAIGRLERGSASHERLLRSKLCSILDAADALILKENLPWDISIVISTNSNGE
ncbi:Peroxisomal NADH pyrophosphatase NUDT12 [Fusarium oxysporum f. sp. rapae]|uniref:Peroxisomal NADH pyrophosphatase NUDT12 n=1 Tax=Fusarium oxysporum f. sp. rapae TaxID=485398 RepID=A0A8J5NQS1_FUSOX|nr:Peroxisomal NADH pyrophosphatase NUDT12 [Fusarium oxysporum f. sp. rapae]